MKPDQVGRLAFRVEGDLWVAYYALPDTMDEALFLGSIRMAIVQKTEAKHAFMAIMRDAMSDILEEQFGERPDWPDPHGRPAPEHERSGGT